MSTNLLALTTNPVTVTASPAKHIAVIAPQTNPMTVIAPQTNKIAVKPSPTDPIAVTASLSNQMTLTPSLPPSPLNVNIEATKFQTIQDHLKFFSEKMGVNLQDRSQRGLDVIAMLAVPELQKNIKKICENEQIKFKDLLEMAKTIHNEGEWKYSDALYLAYKNDYAEIINKTDEEIYQINTARVYLLLNKIDADGGREKDMSQEEFLSDYERINLAIKSCAKHGLAFVADMHNMCSNSLLEKKNGSFVVHGNDFLPIILESSQPTSGVLQDKDGMLFIGSKDKINLDDLVSKFGLTKKTTSDRGHNVTIYTNQQGDEILKALSETFIVVLNKNLNLATKIASEKFEEIGPKDVQNKIFFPTSAAKDPFLNHEEQKRQIKLAILEHPEIKNIFDTNFPIPKKDKDISNLSIDEKRNEFYKDLISIKGRAILLDIAIDSITKNFKIEVDENKKTKKTLRQIISNSLATYDNETPEKQKEIMKNLIKNISTAINGNQKKIKEKAKATQIRQCKKMEETQRIVDKLSGVISSLNKPTDIQDLAGGAGDLGIAVAYEFMLRNKEVGKMQVVDPSADLDTFFRDIIEDLPTCYGFDELKQNGKLEFSKITLQEAKILDDALVVAKHPCGTLADEIITLCKNSNPLALCMMTCCQSKAASETAKYGFTQEAWEQLCILTEITGTEEGYDKAEKAQRLIDQARVSEFKNYCGGKVDIISALETVTYNIDKTRMPKSHVIGFVRREEPIKNNHPFKIRQDNPNFSIINEIENLIDFFIP